MASCTIYTSEPYTLGGPEIDGPPRLSAGFHEEFQTMTGRSMPRHERSLWNHVPARPSAETLVKRAGTWVAVDEPLEADVAAGYTIHWGGHQNPVTGQDLVDMFNDGALSADEVCGGATIGVESPSGPTVEVSS